MSPFNHSAPLSVSYYNPNIQHQGPPLTYSPQPPNPPPPIDSSSPEAWDYGFHRRASILQSPPLGAGVIGLALFFLIIFAPNVLLSQVTLVTLGITVTIGTAAFLFLISLILFVI